jgi:hypothetical protein
MRAIVACRTPLLGAQAVQCDRCGLIELRYHSCRNRHCPKCQTDLRQSLKQIPVQTTTYSGRERAWHQDAAVRVGSVV